MVVIIIMCLTQQHRLLLLPVALLESSDSLLFYQVAVNIRTPGLKNLQEPKWVHKLGTWNQTNTSLERKILTVRTQSAVFAGRVCVNVRDWLCGMGYSGELSCRQCANVSADPVLEGPGWDFCHIRWDKGVNLGPKKILVKAFSAW